MNRANLRRTISQYFNESDLKTICFDLDIDYEAIPGEDKNNKIIELIKLTEREGRTSALLDACQLLRPNVSFNKQTKSSTNPIVEELSKKLETKRVVIDSREFNLAEIVIKASTVIATGALIGDIALRMFDQPNAKYINSIVYKLKTESLWHQIIDAVGELVILGLLRVEPAQPSGYAEEVYFFTDDGLRVVAHLREGSAKSN